MSEEEESIHKKKHAARNVLGRVVRVQVVVIAATVITNILGMSQVDWKSREMTAGEWYATTISTSATA
jgi:hypothetical protein